MGSVLLPMVKLGTGCYYYPIKFIMCQGRKSCFVTETSDTSEISNTSDTSDTSEISDTSGTAETSDTSEISETLEIYKISHIYRRFRRSRMSRISRSPIYPRKFLVNLADPECLEFRDLRYIREGFSEISEVDVRIGVSRKMQFTGYVSSEVCKHTCSE